jgi:DNA-binding NarL/FixJ family response regulator
MLSWRMKINPFYDFGPNAKSLAQELNVQKKSIKVHISFVMELSLQKI